ncbi:MAG: hypothetical protein IJZ64_01430 [Ruminococcus sp.]|nr:hypothetical protein [Ruminococcus sp.]
MNIDHANGSTLTDYTKTTYTTREDNNGTLITDCSGITINNNYYNNLEYAEIFESAFKQGFETALRLLTNFN